MKLVEADDSFHDNSTWLSFVSSSPNQIQQRGIAVGPATCCAGDGAADAWASKPSRQILEVVAQLAEC